MQLAVGRWLGKRTDPSAEEKVFVFDRAQAEKELPAYIGRLVAGYEFRTYYDEIFECFRKVVFVAIPVFFIEDTIFSLLR